METKPKKSQGNDLKERVLRLLYFEKILSCADLSELTSRSIPLISKILNELIKEGFVVDHGYAPSSGGRRPLMYSLKPDKMLIVAVAMDQLSTRIAIVDLLNNYVSGTETVELTLLNNKKALPILVEQINAFIKKSTVDRKTIIGVGIGMPGFIDAKEGINYTYLDTFNGSLQAHIAQKVNLPVFIDNDSSVIALAELKFGKARSKKESMVINIGWGIGLGMIVDGRLFRGHSGFAGEFSHIPMSEDGTLCVCGKRGCLEAEASMLVVTKKAIEEIKKGRISSLQHVLKDQSELIGDAVLHAANKGDQYAIELLSDAGYKIGKGLATLIHIMNPESIVLSGRGAMVGRILMAPIQQALNKYCIPRLAEKTSLEISDLGYDAELIGAATLVMENFKHK